MGGRGTSGATYRRRVKVAQQLAKVNKQIEAIEDEMKVEIRNNEARSITRDVKEGYIKSIADGIKENSDWYFEDYEEYTTLKTKQKRLKNELHMLNNGQRVFFA